MNHWRYPLTSVWQAVEFYFTHLDWVGSLFRSHPRFILPAALAVAVLMFHKVFKLVTYQPESSTLARMRQKGTIQLAVERILLLASYVANAIGVILMAISVLLLLRGNLLSGRPASTAIHFLRAGCVFFLLGVTLNWQVLSGNMLRGVVVWWKRRMPRDFPEGGWGIGCCFASLIFFISFGTTLLAPVSSALVTQRNWPSAVALLRYAPNTFLVMALAPFCMAALSGRLRHVAASHYQHRGETRLAQFCSALPRWKILFASMDCVFMFIGSIIVLLAGIFAAIDWIWFWSALLVFLRSAGGHKSTT